MIKSETITINGEEYTRTYSGEGRYIRKTGTDEVYTEAVDVLESAFTYEETDNTAESEDEANGDVEVILMMIEKGEL